MKKILILVLVVGYCITASSQATEKAKKTQLLAEIAALACNCVDSIDVYNKSKEDVSKEINKCLKEQTQTYQLTAKLISIDSLKDKAPEKDGKKQINISINLDENSEEFKKFYYEIERFMMDSCKGLKIKVASFDKQNDKSVSKNPAAIELYTKGQDEMAKANHKEAIGYFEKAVAIDPDFAFAWDNIGISYRKLGDYDKALNAYKKSLKIDPNGLMPLQNIAIVYQYKKDFPEAIKTYEKLALIEKDNPEVFYGIGQIYATKMNEYEKGLENMCKAYNLYIVQKSAYRTDAEKVIRLIYGEMKKQGKEDKFNEILKANNITPN